MRKSLLALSILATALAAPLAQAYEAGDVIVRAGAATVDPQEDSSALKLNGATLGGQATVDSDTQLGLTGTFMLTDVVSVTEYAGIGVLGAGILLMARGIFTSGEDRKLLPFALGSACATAGYTMIDGLGARVSGDAIGYVAWVFVADGTLFATGMLLYKGLDILPRNRKAWVTGLIASAASYGAYGVSVWAMMKAPIAVVAALRETSILFAVLIGWLAFGERMTRDKAIASLMIVAGVIVTRL